MSRKTRKRRRKGSPPSENLPFFDDPEADDRINDHHREDQAIVDKEQTVDIGDGRRRRMPAPGT